MEPIKSVEILIPVYYPDPSLFLTIETCFSTLQACYPGIKVTCIDDCSPLDLPPHWDMEETNVANLGWVRTVNRLLEISTADVVVVCNDDVTFHLGCLDRYFTLPDMVIASPSDTASGGLKGMGCCWGMTRTTYEAMGPLDERYRNYYADTEYIARAGRKGVKVVTWDDVTLEHVESATFNLTGKEQLQEEDRRIFEA